MLEFLSRIGHESDMHVPDIWDVVVIGAGPAGSSAAISAARLGLQVLQLDAKKFPRRKVCGGCLNQVSKEHLRDLIGEENPVWNSVLTLGQFQMTHRGRQFRFETPPGVAVDRSVLDQELVIRGQRDGVTFLPFVSAKLGPTESDSRIVHLQSGPNRTDVRARSVVLACGLGNRSAVSEPSLQQSVSPSSRVGVEAIFSGFPKQYSAGSIHMVVAADGYVGLTVIAGGRLHVAAAVDRAALQRLGPEETVQKILQDAGASVLPSDTSAIWRGTPPLTARARNISAERVFLVGDAAGYVEPFTGEGIRWALESGMGVAQFLPLCRAGWEPQIAARWNGWYESNVIAEQQLCRRITSGLKQPTTRWLAHQVLRFQPRIAASIISRLNTDARR